MTTRVLIADDHRLLRDGLRRTITSYGMKVVGEATDGDEAVKMALSLLPDVVIMDVSMPYCDGIEATRLIKEAREDIAVVILTMHIDDEVQQDASDVGADAYLFKDCSSKEIISTIEALFPTRSEAAVEQEEGEPAAPVPAESEGARVVELASKEGSEGGGGGSGEDSASSVGGSGRSPVEAGGISLSGREIEILQLFADGLSSNQIADSLGISERTIRNHLGAAYAKMGVADKTQAIVKAIQLGVVVV